MLSEFAFTPSIFDESIQTDPDAWRAQLDRLAERLFPQGYPCPVIIANLGSGGWKNAAQKQVQRIGDPNIRSRAMSLFCAMSNVMIERPLIRDWPEEGDQLAWCIEATETGNTEPIDRVVACRFAIPKTCSVPREVRCLTEVRDAGFWNGIPADDSPEMSINAQVQLLKKLCMHA